MNIIISRGIIMSKKFVNIHSHTEYSLLDGSVKIEEMFNRVKELGQDTVSITDHGVMHGMIVAMNIAKKVGIKLLVGCEFYISPYGRTAEDKNFNKGEKSASHLIVIAKNTQGYKNLNKLNHLAWSRGFYRKPRIDREMLEAYSDGLIVTSACMAGPLSMAILDGHMDYAIKDLEFFARVFKEDFYIEIQNHNIPEERVAMEESKRLAIKYGIPMVVGIDTHYLYKEDKDVHDALICIGSGQKIDGDRRWKFEGDGYYHMDEQEVLNRFPNDQEAIYNTGILADKCNEDIIPTGELKIPYFNIPADSEFERWEGESIWLP